MTSEGRCDENTNCTSTSECYVQLPRRAVEQMTEMCRVFVMTTAQPTSTANHATQTDDVTEQQRVIDNNNCCSTDIDSLKKTLRQLADKNICWQTLCNEKDVEILDLKQRLKQAQCLLTQQMDSQPSSNTTCQHQYTDTSTVDAHRRQLEHTISSLTESLVDKQATIDTLQLQVVIYRQDFQSEREDRERAQSQIAELQAQLNKLSQLQQRTAAAAAVDTQVEHSRVDYFSHRLPQHHRHYGNTPAAVGWYPRLVGGTDITDGK